MKLFVRCVAFIDKWAHFAFGEKFNPFARTGAIAMTCLVIAVASGVLLIPFYSVSVEEAHDSITHMLNGLWWSAGLIHSLHRYSADATMLFTVLHLIKILAAKAYTGSRRFSWLTGIISLGLLWLTGWTGYWLLWDQVGFLVALFSAKFIDALTFLGLTLEPIILLNDSTSNTVFFVIFFIHMLIPLGLLTILWVHVSRVNRPQFFVDKKNAFILGGVLVAVSLFVPALLAPKASPFTLMEVTYIDWFYLFPLKLFSQVPMGWVWILSFLTSLLLLFFPWIKREKPIVPSFVTNERCVGCSNCFTDCPYEAVMMLPRTDGAPYKQVAWVNPDKCVGCGICNGACDSNGNNLPWLETDSIENKIDTWTQPGSESTKLLFLCDAVAGPYLSNIDSAGQTNELPGYRIIRVPCAGHVNPKSISRALEKGFKGVYIAASLPGSCIYREGSSWIRDRVQKKRKPFVKLDPQNGTKVHVGYYARLDIKTLTQDLLS